MQRCNAFRADLHCTSLNCSHVACIAVKLSGLSCIECQWSRTSHDQSVSSCSVKRHCQGLKTAHLLQSMTGHSVTSGHWSFCMYTCRGAMLYIELVLHACCSCCAQMRSGLTWSVASLWQRLQQLCRVHVCIRYPYQKLHWQTPSAPYSKYNVWLTSI